MLPMPAPGDPRGAGSQAPRSQSARSFNSKQQVFLDFVLSHYVSVGVEELDQEKLTPLLRLKYHDSIADAVADLGKPEEIGGCSRASRSICISSCCVTYRRSKLT